MLKTPFASFLLVLLISGTALAALPQESPEDVIVNLKANSLKYEEEKGIVVASGSAEATLRDLLIKADKILIDTKTNVCTAEGNVSLSKGEYAAKAVNLTYNASTETATLFNFRSTISPPEIKGKLYLRAEELIDKAERKEGSGGEITTCDYEDPHYILRAHRFEYYPGDKIVGYWVTLYFGRIPAAFSPYWVFSFKKRRSSNIPTIGHNDVEGDFAKSAFDYFINNDANGVIYLDSTQIKGPGYGIEHDYRLNPSNEGMLYLYYIHERDTDLYDSVAKINHNYKLSKETNLNISHNYSNIYTIPAGRLDQATSKVELTQSGERKLNIGFDLLDNRLGYYQNYNFRAGHSFGGYDTNYTLSLSRGTKAPLWSRLTERITHSQPFLLPSSTFSTTINYLKNTTLEGTPADELLEPQITVTQKGDFYTATLTENMYVDLDRDLYTADKNNEYLEREPEATLNFRGVDLGLLNLTTDLGFGRFHEAKYVSQLSRIRHFTTNRYKAGLNADKTYILGGSSTLYLMAGLDQFAYDTSDARYAFREKISLKTELGGFFRNNVDYNRGISEGNTPFFFDNIGNFYNNIKDTITLYYLDKVTWTIDGGYNWQASKYFDLMTRLDVKLSERLHMSLSGGYDIENQKYRDLVTSTRVIPIGGLTVDINSVHDLNTGVLKSADSLIDYEFGEDWISKWHLRVGHVYDYLSGRFLLRDLMIVKDLHCWEAKFMYSDYRKEWSVTFTLKAFPEMPIGWATYQGFYFEGFNKEELLKESPRRY